MGSTGAYRPLNVRKRLPVAPIILVQYWRSMEQLLASQAFNKAIGTDGAVGIWHETYAASPGSYENIYVNMPPFGLGRPGELQPVTGKRQSAGGRLAAHKVDA